MDCWYSSWTMTAQAVVWVQGLLWALLAREEGLA